MTDSILRKVIVLVLIPVFAIFVQFFLRMILGTDFNTIGITLGTLGIGQLLPFLYFDHFITNKIFGLKPTYDIKQNEVSIKYKMSVQSLDSTKIDGLKNQFLLVIFLNLALFLVIIYLGVKGEIVWHTIFGGISCLSSWYLLIFK
ncbi:hypothetical protein [Allomuricauda sp. M10]|uniref:hypothetical protein n=1 Tax=Allomuricauda sp. M10 TaxID=2683292 RepID=UPI001D194516|nr:hypothetical protein [Muricauda sp. M10]